MTAVLAPRPALGLPRPWTLPPVDDWIDESRIRVLVCDSGPPGIVNVQLVFHRGDAHEAGLAAGATRLAARMISEGAAGLDAAAIVRRFDELAAGFGIGVDHFDVTATVESLTETVADALAQTARLVAAPHFDPQAFQFLRMMALRGVSQAKSSPAALAAAARSEARYGTDSPWGRRTGGTAASLAALTLDDLAAVHESVVAAPLTLVVTGDAARVDIAGLVDAVDATIPAPGVHPPTFPTPTVASDPAQILLVDRPGAPQSMIRAGHVQVLDLVDATTHVSIQVLDKVLTGGGSRLNELLREQRGVTYGVHGTFGRGRNLCWLDIDTDVERTATGMAIREIVDVVTNIAGGDVSTAEVTVNAEQLLGSRVLRLQTPAGIGMAVRQRVTHGTPDNWFATTRDALVALAPSDVNRVARDLVHPERLQIAVVGDADAIGADLEGTGLPVVRHDPSAWFDGAA